MSLLYNLIEQDEMAYFMHDLISYEALNEIRFYLIMKLRNMGIPVLKEHIEVKPVGNRVDVNVAPELELLLIELEKKAGIFY